MEETFNMRRTFAGFTAVLLLLSFAISCEKPSISDENGASDNKLIDRELVNIEFTPEDGMSKSVTSDNGQNAWLSIRWNESEEESISVYIQKESAVYYAGDIVSPASAGNVRTFSGSVLAKEEGEKYIYLHPSLKSQETQGVAAKAVISLSSQNGLVSGLNGIMPCVWRENDSDGVTFQRPVYFIKLTLDFETDPGSLTSLVLETMNRNAEDRVFPAYFKAANLSDEHNASLASLTDGTALASNSDYSKSISLSHWAEGATPKQRIAYLMSSSVENLNVFSSKFRFVAKTSNGTFYGEFRSFPGQGSEEAQTSRTLTAFENGKVYRASRTMSPVAPATSINDGYSVYSLLGLWNEYGKPYDPDNKVIEASALATSNAPQSLKNILGTSDLQSAFTSKMNMDTGASGTPNFMGRLYKSAGNSTNAGKTIKLTKDCKVFVTMVSENAWDRNLLGYYFFPFNGSDEGSQPTSAQSFAKYIVFPDVSRPYHVPFNTDGSGTTATPPNIGASANAPVQQYTTVQLIYKDENGFSHETFPANTFLGFFVMSRAMTERGEDMLNWSRPRFFTNYGLSTASSSINPFAAGDIIKPAADNVGSYDSDSEAKLKDLGIFGFRDNVNDNANTAFATMIFVVSTDAGAGNEDALSMQNTAAFNLSAASSANLVVGRTATHTITRDVATGITCSNYTENLDGTQTSYEFTMTLDDPLYGGFKDVLVKHGDATIAPYSTTSTTQSFKIDNVSANISIKASTQNLVKVKALTAAQINELTNPSGMGESNYKLLIQSISSHQADGTFSFDGDGNLITLPSSQSPFWAMDSKIIADSSAPGFAEVDPLGKYVSYYWTLEKDGDTGFILSNVSGSKLSRGPAYSQTYDWPLVAVNAEGTALVAEAAGNGGYDVKLKTKAAGNKNYDYMTSRIGTSNPVPIFNAAGSHVETYGKWRVYKLWTE